MTEKETSPGVLKLTETHVRDEITGQHDESYRVLRKGDMIEYKAFLTGKVLLRATGFYLRENSEVEQEKRDLFFRDLEELELNQVN